MVENYGDIGTRDYEQILRIKSEPFAQPVEKLWSGREIKTKES